MKKTTAVLFTTLLMPAAFAASTGTRYLATAPSAVASAPSPATSWMLGNRTRGLTVGAAASGAAATSIGFASFRNETESFRWTAGFQLTEPPHGADSRYGADLDFGYRIYRLAAGNLKGFTQPGVRVGKANDGGSFGDDSYGAFYYKFGAEYFFSPNFAIGAMAGIELAFTKGFNQIDLGTGSSAAFLSWYW